MKSRPFPGGKKRRKATKHQPSKQVNETRLTRYMPSSSRLLQRHQTPHACTAAPKRAPQTRGSSPIIPNTLSTSSSNVSTNFTPNRLQTICTFPRLQKPLGQQTTNRPLRAYRPSSISEMGARAAGSKNMTMAVQRSRQSSSHSTCPRNSASEMSCTSEASQWPRRGLSSVTA